MTTATRTDIEAILAAVVKDALGKIDLSDVEKKIAEDDADARDEHFIREMVKTAMRQALRWSHE